MENVGDKTVAVVDGVRQKPYDEIIVPGFGLDFSPDSSKIGFFARENKNWFLVMDGKEQREHQPEEKFRSTTLRLSMRYSEEGAHHCYTAEAADGQYLVVDGKAVGDKFAEVFGCTFSHDGKRIAYPAREKRGEKVFYVIDGVKQKGYDLTGTFTFSPDGKRFAYTAYPSKASSQIGRWEFIVLDGREEKEYYKVFSVLFSPDSKRTAYAAELGTDVKPKGAVVLDGQEISDERAGLGSFWVSGIFFPKLVFSPDSKRIAYGAEVLPVKSLFAPKPPPKSQYNVIDGKPGKPYEGVSLPVFSPDSRRIAYYGRVQKRQMMLIDNEEGKPYDDVGHPVFSPDSTRVGYRAQQGGDRFIVVDGKEYAKYEGVSNPVFSPDSKRTCYIARKSGKVTVVIDDVEGQFYDEIYARRWRKKVTHAGIGFSSQDSFHYFAKKGNELIFVQETIGTPD